MSLEPKYVVLCKLYFFIILVQKDMEISLLPPEQLDYLLQFLNLNSLKNLSRTSTYFYEATERIISEKCVIDISSSYRIVENNRCDIKLLKRKYFNVRIENFSSQLEFNRNNIIPKNIYFDVLEGPFLQNNNLTPDIEKVFVSETCVFPLRTLRSRRYSSIKGKN